MSDANIKRNMDYFRIPIVINVVIGALDNASASEAISCTITAIVINLLLVVWPQLSEPVDRAANT